MEEHQLTVSHTCRVVGLSRAAWYRPPTPWTVRDAEVIDALTTVVGPHPRWGFWKCRDRLRLDGRPWNHKRLHRVYCALGLNIRRRTKRRVPTRPRQPLAAPTTLNAVWALDFMHDTLYGGRRFRTLNVLDEANREGLGIEVGTSIPAARVIRVMEQLGEIYGYPAAIRLDNGPALVSAAFSEWCRTHGIKLLSIQPGKPDQNAFMERFNRTYREEVLDAYVFESVWQVQDLSDRWLPDYNEQRPHDALGRVPPLTFLPRPIPSRMSTYELST